MNTPPRRFPATVPPAVYRPRQVPTVNTSSIMPRQLDFDDEFSTPRAPVAPRTPGAPVAPRSIIRSLEAPVFIKI